MMPLGSRPSPSLLMETCDKRSITCRQPQRVSGLSTRYSPASSIHSAPLALHGRPLCSSYSTPSIDCCSAGAGSAPFLWRSLALREPSNRACAARCEFIVSVLGQSRKAHTSGAAIATQELTNTARCHLIAMNAGWHVPRCCKHDHSRAVTETCLRATALEPCPHMHASHLTAMRDACSKTSSACVMSRTRS